MEKTPVNKDLILREKLAIERTIMANDRTFLSFIRTSLYFAVAGLSINEFMQLQYGRWVVFVFGALSVFLLIVGALKYYGQKKKINEAKRHIGNYKGEWEEESI